MKFARYAHECNAFVTDTVKNIARAHSRNVSNKIRHDGPLIFYYIHSRIRSD